MRRSDLLDDVVLATSTVRGAARTPGLRAIGEYSRRGLTAGAASSASPGALVDGQAVVGDRFVNGDAHRATVGWSGLVKSAMDFGFAVVLLVMLAPVMALIAILIKLDSRGPVIFRQERNGLNGRKFDIIKFRTMHHRDFPETIVRQCTRDDPRLTRVGRFLRRTSLDELPQIFNVLNGTMSLVGPRPHAVCHNAEYGKLISEYDKRHLVKPGITGWAQLNGLRGETPTVASMALRVKHDIFYVKHWSPAFDLRILLLTPVVIFGQKSAF